MEYWATKSTDSIGNELFSRIENFNEYLTSSGLMTELKRSYKTYYGNSNINEAGVQGELKTIQVNNYANLIRHILTMVTSQRPSFEPRATNTDVKSQSQTILASGLLDYYMREKRLERHLKQATELALFLREGWISTTWNVTGGNMYGVTETGAVVFEGDVQYKVHKLNDVIRDVEREDSDFDWIIVRSHKNKFDLAAKYPELAEKITSISSDSADMSRFRLSLNSNDETDEIPIYTFYHKRTEALPNGRQIDFVAHDCILFDGSLPYRTIPVYRITASEMIETSFGHSPAFDLLPLQDALDTAFSTVLTNQAAFGVQNVLVPRGSGISVTNISGGLNLIEYDKNLGAPEPLNLTQTPPEIFNFINLLNQFQEAISGVNAVARGQASPSLSGAAMALLQSTALQFSSGVQQSYIALLEDVGSATVHLLADFAKVPRIAYIAGKNNRSLMREFKDHDLQNISRVTVDSANALTKTTAGRVEIANQLLQAGMIKRPEQYLMVIQTGQLEPVLENETSVLMLIRGENERLSEGKAARAILTDDHTLHINEHLAVLGTPESRENPEIVSMVLAHIQEHIELAKSMPVELQQILGRQPIQSSAPQAMPQVLDATYPITEQSNNVNLPSMPTNPLTGQQVSAEGLQ